MANTVKIPDGYQVVMPYLIVPNAAKFSLFMQMVFGAKEVFRAMRDENTIQHAELNIDGSKIMFADSTDRYAPFPASLFIYVEDADAVFAKATGAGATIVSPLGDQPYGRSGGVSDPFGNTWWITSVK